MVASFVSSLSGVCFDSDMFGLKFDENGHWKTEADDKGRVIRKLNRKERRALRFGKKRKAVRR